MRGHTFTLPALALAAMLATACGSSKKIVDGGGNTVNPTTVTTTGNNAATAAYQVAKRVQANAVGTKNIVSSIDFNLKKGSKDVSVSGKISMRRDQVIRIQLTPMGLVEVGRVELTPDTVLIVDRMHKQYVKVGYGDVPFLKNNGINFYSLQALFWNQLFVPGKQKPLDADLKLMQLDGQQLVLENGKMRYVWDTDSETAQIRQTHVAYDSTNHGKTSLEWKYDRFKAFQGKQMPTQHDIRFATSKGNEIQVGIKMGNLKTDADWDVSTKVSTKYKPVDLQEVINLILKLG